ncbi:helix-turn-helix transcriptional regulator [Pseudooceanicola sp. 200-1SW]|uniref:helix-turn-helix transcriptional regulator n=1 Tax=Pseudooceanicola sp. 200-1SW TaxID=3425949 RepID=UPI003D7FC69B
MHKRPGRSPAVSGGKPTAQAAWAGAPGAAPLYDRVIGRLYDVALDPRHLEDFLDDWDRLLRPLRALRGAEGGLADAPPETAAEGAEQAQALAAALGPHLQRVIRLLNQSAAAPILPPEEALLRQLARRAAFTVDSDLGLSGVTAAATALLEVRPGDPLTRLPLERAHLALLEDRLRRLLAPHRDAPELAATARGPATAPSGRRPAEGATPPGSEALDLLRLRLASGGQLLLAQLARHRPPDGPPFALVATSLLDWPAGLNALLRAAFGLTRAETEILRGLSEARSLRDIAGARGRSVETVRAQIKALMAKTETRSQAELLRLVLSLGPLPTLEESRPPGPDHWVVRSPAELAAARIQDGRHRLAVEQAQVAAAGSGSALRSSTPEDGLGDAKGAALAAMAPDRQRQAAAPDPDRPLPAPPGRGRRSGGMVRFSHGGGLLPLRPFARLARPGGRQVEYLELGAPEGRPVLWLHGPQGVCRLPARHEAAAQRLDLRLLVPIRAGYGASDPPPRAGRALRRIAPISWPCWTGWKFPARRSSPFRTSWPWAPPCCATPRRGSRR